MYKNARDWASIEEVTGTSYTGKNRMRFPFYTDCIIIDAFGESMKENQKCLCCQIKIPKKRPRRCPICKHVFQGNGWDGIDAHWRAKHEDIMSYKKFWKSLCSEHKS